jgi:hypothetical protein
MKELTRDEEWFERQLRIMGFPDRVGAKIGAKMADLIKSRPALEGILENVHQEFLHKKFWAAKQSEEYPVYKESSACERLSVTKMSEGLKKTISSMLRISGEDRADWKRLEKNEWIWRQNTEEEQNEQNRDALRVVKSIIDLNENPVKNDEHLREKWKGLVEMIESNRREMELMEYVDNQIF